MQFDHQKLKHALDNKYQLHLGNIQKDYPEVDLEDILDFAYENESLDDIHTRPELRMFEFSRLENRDWTPKILLDLLEDVKQVEFMHDCSIVGFLADESDTGYGLHFDYFDLFAINVIGESIWQFENEEIKMIPGDVMFVPAGLEHQVIGLTPRFTASITSPVEINIPQ